MTDQRMNPDLIHDILDVLDRQGYARTDDEHAARPVLLIGDLAHIYEGAQDHPFGPYHEVSPSRTELAPPGPFCSSATWPTSTKAPRTTRSARTTTSRCPGPNPHLNRPRRTP